MRCFWVWLLPFLSEPIPTPPAFKRVCGFRHLVHGAGMFAADARRFCPPVDARGAQGKIQTLPLQRLCRGMQRAARKVRIAGDMSLFF